MAEYRVLYDRYPGLHALVDSGSDFVELGASKITWRTYPHYLIGEKLGLLELGIRAGLFPEHDQEYGQLASAALDAIRAVSRGAALGADAPLASLNLRHPVPDLLAGFEQRASAAVLGVEPTSTLKAIPDKSAVAAFALFEDVRHILDYLDVDDGRAAIELTLGRTLTWESSVQAPTAGEAPIDLAVLLRSIERLGDSLLHENAFADQRREHGPDATTPDGLRLPPAACLFLVESLVCLDDVIQLVDEIPRLPVTEGKRVLPDPDLASLVDETNSLLSELPFYGQREKVERSIRRFFGQLRVMAEQPEQASGMAQTIRMQLGESSARPARPSDQ